jgi:hypothetical protein
MPVQASRPGCCQCQFVPRDVIAMGVRNEAPRLTTTHVDRQLGRRQKQSSVVMKQNAPRLRQGLFEVEQFSAGRKAGQPPIRANGRNGSELTQ